MLRVDHLMVHDWHFHGGDDRLAPKGNTTNMRIVNMTCIGGGIAFSSTGQYVDSPDYIYNVTATNARTRLFSYVAVFIPLLFSNKSATLFKQ